MTLNRLACLVTLIASVALAGCNGQDEAKARNDCDKTKAADCTAPGKQATEKNLGGLAKALQK